MQFGSTLTVVLADLDEDPFDEFLPLRLSCDHVFTALPTPTLETERLRLRPFTDVDAEDLFALQSDAYVLR